ncbi:hypothetical protein MBH78_19975 [Oceanimonas sp. NS1]|nr:hypothetical protein [Oceanimonas sp. NS1]
MFTGIRVMLVVVSLLLVFVALNLLTQRSLNVILMLLIGVGYVAYILPVFVLERLANKRA